MFSCRKVNPVYIVNLCIVLSYLVWAVSNLESRPSILQCLATFLLIVSGLMVFYSLRFFFAALNVIFTNATSLTYVWYQFYRLGTRPHALYPSWLRWVVLTIFPVGLISSVPATVLVHGLDSRLVLGSLAISTLLVFLTTRFWNYVLQRYTSASS